MDRKIFLPIFIAVALPFVAQAQEQPGARVPSGPKPTPADVQRVVGTITADRGLDEQIAKAEQSRNQKQAEELAKKAGEMSQKLGAEYNDLMERLQQIDPSSQEGQQISAVFEPLEKQCTAR
jgi:hypothetical protein